MEANLKTYFKAKDIYIDTICDEEDNIVYRVNGQELKNENQESISEHEFNLIVKREVSKYIHPFENIVVLAGAGASIVNDEEGAPSQKFGHTIKMLTEAIDKVISSEPSFFLIEELCDMCKYSIPLKRAKTNEKGEAETYYNPDFILEDFLSKVLSYEEFMNEDDTKKKYILTKEMILETIKNKTSYSFEQGVHNHDSFIKSLSSLIKSPSRLSIVTTNYDTLFEEAADTLNFTVFDGFSFTSNPRFDVDLFDWFLVKPVLNVKSDKVEYKRNVINLLKIHGSLTWKQEKEGINRCDKESNQNPIMIFPSSNKYSHSYEKPYFELFSKFQELLKMPNTLFITTGFSFADNHIAKMITQAIKSNQSLTLLTTDYSIDDDYKTPNWLELVSLMKKGFRIAFLKGTMADEIADYFGTVQYEN